MNSKTMNNFLKQAILVGVFSLPFIFLPFFNAETYFPFIVTKNFTFRIITGIIFVLWLILALRDNDYLPKKSHLAIGLAGFLGVMAIATVASENPFKSFWSNYERMEGYVTLLHLGAYFLVAGTMLTTRKIWDSLFHTSLGMSLFLGLYALLQMMGELAIEQGIGRVEGTLGNAAYFGVYILVHIFFAIFYFVNRKEKEDAKGILLTAMVGFGLFFLYYPILTFGEAYAAKAFGSVLTVISLVGLVLAAYYRFGMKEGKIPHYVRSGLYAVLIALLTFVLVKTETRGSIIGFGVAGLFTAIGIFLTAKDRPILKKLALGSFVAIVLFFGGVGLFKDSKFVGDHSSLRRVASFMTVNVGKFASTEGKSRFAVWNTAFKGFVEKPVFGWGQESYNYVFYKHYNPKMYDQEAWFDRAHNVFLDWLIAGGILGLTGYLSLFFFALWYVWRKKSHYDLSNEEKVVLTGLFGAYFIHNLFVFDNIGSYLVFFTTLAFLHSAYAEKCDKLENFVKKQSENLLTFGVPAIMVLGVFGIYWFSVPSFVKAFQLNDALSAQPKGISENIRMFKDLFASPFVGTYEAREQITIAAMRVGSANVDPAVKTELFNLSYSELKKQLVETPKDARYWYFMGGLLSSYGRTSEAVAVWEKAVENAPRKQMMLFNLGSAYLQVGNQGAAVEAFKKAYEAYPAYQEAALQYFAISGQKDKLVELAKQRHDTNPLDVNLHIAYGLALAEAGQKNQAISEIRKVITQVPDFKTQGEDLIKQIQQGKINR